MDQVMDSQLYHALSELKLGFDKIKTLVSDWERHFLVDTLDRFEKYGVDTYFSPKQESRVIAIWEEHEGLLN